MQKQSDSLMKKYRHCAVTPPSICPVLPSLFVYEENCLHFFSIFKEVMSLSQKVIVPKQE